jgi:hypothetical protein
MLVVNPTDSVGDGVHVTVKPAPAGQEGGEAQPAAGAGAKGSF